MDKTKSGVMGLAIGSAILAHEPVQNSEMQGIMKWVSHEEVERIGRRHVTWPWQNFPSEDSLSV